jgi:poly(A) polymerase
LRSDSAPVPGELRAFAVTVATALQAAGFEAWFAGGCVRDEQLGRTPADYDIATNATPTQVQALFPRTHAFGASFGVVLVVADDNPALNVEVVTFRSEGGYFDGRHPENVVFATAHEDVQRRDFTINGLLQDPVTGEIRDHVGGLADLSAGVIRAIGEPGERFREDHLRMLRAVRFAAKLGFTIEPATFAAIQASAPLITRISAERNRAELTGILTSGRAGHGFRLLDELGLLDPILPEIPRMHGVTQPPEFHPEGDVFVHTMMLLDLLTPEDPPTVAWACLLHDVAKPDTWTLTDRIRFHGHEGLGAEQSKGILARLRFSNEETELIVELVRDHLKFAHVKLMREATLKRFLWHPYFSQHLRLHWIDCMASHQDLSAWRFCQEKLAEWGTSPPPRAERLITGRDLSALGLVPGPHFKTLLEAVDDAQLEGRVTTREEALALVQSLRKGP